MSVSPQTIMFANADDLNHKCYIAKWLPSGKFLYESYPDVNAFLDKYDGLTDEAKMYGEIHREGRPVCEYYDIDEQNKGQDISEWIDSFITARNEFCQTIDIVGIQRNQVIAFESCDENKFSLHLLVRNKYHFKTIAAQKEYARKFSSWCDEKGYPFGIDVSVYNKNSVFRCPGSHKPQQTRTFNPTKALSDKALGFCSTIEVGSLPHTIDVAPPKIRPDISHDYSNDALFNLFDKLDKSRWDDRDSWRNLIWLGVKEGLSRDQLCELSSQSDKHEDDAVDVLIDGFIHGACAITMGTLKFYLKQDISKDDYDALFAKPKVAGVTLEDLRRGHGDVAAVISKKMDRLKLCNEAWWKCNAKNLWSVVRKPHAYVAKMIQNDINDCMSLLNNRINDAADEARKALEDERKELTKFYTQVGGPSYAPCVLNFLSDHLEDNEFSKKIDHNVGLLAFKNGVLDLRSGVFREGVTPEDYISFTLDFDYEAVVVDNESFVWKQFKKVLNNSDVHLDYFMSLVGHAFTGESTSVKAMYFMIDGAGGQGDNGKTFLFNIFATLMGKYVGKPNSSLLEKNNGKVHKQIVGLKGKRLIYMEEFPAKAVNADLMKVLGDGGEIDNEVMFGTTETINIVGMVFALSNHTPQLDADEQAGYNRYKEVSFKSHFDRTGNRVEENEKLLEYIADPMLGMKIVREYRMEVVGLILKYATRFYKSGLPPTPKEFLAAETETRQANDPFLEWFSDNLVAQQDSRIAEKRLLELCGFEKKAVRRAMMRRGFVYNRDLKGVGSDGDGKYYKGGYMGVMVADSYNPQDGRPPI